MGLTVTGGGHPPVAAEVARLGELQRSGDHTAVLAQAEPLLAAYPENRDLLLLAAISLRLLGRIDDAGHALDRFAAAHPRYSRLWQERGLGFVARQDAPHAIDALLRAVNLNPALPLSWQMLAKLYRLNGDTGNADRAAAHVRTLAALPPDVVTATALFADGDLDPAEQMVRAWLQRHGDHVEAMRLLAKIGMARDVLDDAEVLLARVLEAEPGHLPARHEYAQCLVQRHKYAAARDQIERLRAADPVNPELRTLSATVAIGLGDQDGAIALYQGLIAEVSGNPDLHLWLGHALKTVGSVPEAVAAYRAAAALRPDFGDAWWSLANLKTYRFDEAEIAVMRAAEDAPGTHDGDRIHLCFALGKALEDRADPAEAWVCYERGNALQRAASRYRPELLEANTAAQIAVCTPAFFAARAGWGAPDADPIFVVGLPRSGSTLIEQILASHSAVEGTQELADVQRIVQDLSGRATGPGGEHYPPVLASLTAGEVSALGARYLDETRVYRTGKPRFIDKMPNNFRHLGLIRLMLPNARIIDARRDPMSCCFSNLKQLFARGQEFAYSVDDIARYYRTYLDLMAHWDRALPGHVLRVQHEDVVDNLDGSVRRILAFCGLPFEQGCVEFHKTRRSVRTPSSEQVRQPIFRDGLDGWRAFEPQLEPLRAVLGDALTRYREP